MRKNTKLDPLRHPGLIRCTGCNKWLPPDDFVGGWNGHGRPPGYCYDCHSFRSKHYYRKRRKQGLNGAWDENHKWATAVVTRDKICQDCGFDFADILEAHHIVPISEDETKRLDVENGVALCPTCHKLRHYVMSLERADMELKNPSLYQATRTNRLRQETTIEKAEQLITRLPPYKQARLWDNENEHERIAESIASYRTA